MKKAFLLVPVAVALAAGAAYLLTRDEPYRARPLPPLRPSEDFAGTVMAPTLETVLPPGRSVVWCGAFQMAWNRMTTDVVQSPLRIRGAEAVAAALNASRFGDVDLVENDYYAAAGKAEAGIAERIREEMARKFPAVKPDLPALEPHDFLAYAYLTAGLRFKFPYRERKEGISFTDGSGRPLRVNGFGLLPHESSRAWGQASVLHERQGEGGAEYVVDLDAKSEPHQILLAMRPRPASLAEAVDWVGKVSGPGRPVGDDDTLLVPDVAFGLRHSFRELEGRDKRFLNAGWENYSIKSARQSVAFRLDRGGAEMKAEASMHVGVTSVKPRPVFRLVFDRPFLLLMKKRGAERPYLAVWIDNTELLDPR